MTIREFLRMLLANKLTFNELKVLLELGYQDFSRDDVLNNTQRCPIDTYSASALTKTLQRLAVKEPPIISSYQANNKRFYRLRDRCHSYGDYEGVLLSIARSKVLTENAIKVALQIILNENRPSTTRSLANQLSITPDYLASTVLHRMLVIGLLKEKPIEGDLDGAYNIAEEDSFPIHAVYLDLNWKGTSKVRLL